MARTGYDFQSLTQENRDWKEARAMSKEIIQFDQAMFETKLDAMVRDKVEQIVNAMLDEEADLIANAARYERSDGRKAYRAGHYARRFTVKAGRLGLKVPKLKGVRLVVGDRCAGLVATVGEMLPQARYQRCMVHFMRNVLSKVPPTHREWASAALKAIFAMESRASALAKAEEVAREMESRRLKAAASCLREGIGETTTYLLDEYPPEHRRRIRTNNMIERLNREIRRRTRVVGSFPDGRSALMLICARIRYVTANDWSSRRYLDMSRLDGIMQSTD